MKTTTVFPSDIHIRKPQKFNKTKHKMEFVGIPKIKLKKIKRSEIDKYMSSEYGRNWLKQVLKKIHDGTIRIL